MTEESTDGEMGEGDETMPEAETTIEEAVTYPLLRTHGQFYPLEHAVRGTARLYELEDGSQVLRFEEFEVDNGPDLAVWLVPNETVPHQIGMVPVGYYDLGKLKGNQGDQNYEIPADVDLVQYKSVVVWYVTLRVPFAAGPLQPVMTEGDETIPAAETGTMEDDPTPTDAPIPLLQGESGEG